VKDRTFLDPALICLLALAALFIFSNLGSVYLWEDEAETALVAKTVVSNGIPKISDGMNYFYQEQGKRVGYGDIWAWTPWLQFYVAAPCVKFLGSREWALRVPFATAGFFSVILLFWISRKLFDRPTAIFATTLLITCVPFLLYVRQCRYYAFVILGTLMAAGSLLIPREHKKLFNLSLFLALLIIFHANYIAWFGIVFAISCWVFIQRTFSTRSSTLTTLALSFAVNLPWFFLFKPLHEKTGEWSADIFLESLIFYAESLNHYVAPFILLLIIPLILWAGRKKMQETRLSGLQKDSILFFVLLIIFTIGFSLLGPARVFRYLVGIIPVVILLFALLFAKLWQKNRIISIALLGILIGSNFLNVFFYPMLSSVFPTASRHLKSALSSPLLSYIQELAQPPQGTIKKIADYLNAHAAPHDFAIATYGDLPLMFYTKLRMIGGLSFEALEEAKNADWVIARKVLISDEDARVMVYLIDNLPWERYEKIDLGQTDFPWDNIPEPSAHQFKSMGFNPDWQIQIYRKLKPEESSRTADPPKLFYFTPAHKTITGAAELKPELARYLIWLKAQNHSEQSPI